MKCGLDALPGAWCHVCEVQRGCGPAVEKAGTYTGDSASSGSSALQLNALAQSVYSARWRFVVPRSEVKIEGCVVISKQVGKVWWQNWAQVHGGEIKLSARAMCLTWSDPEVLNYSCTKLKSPYRHSGWIPSDPVTSQRLLYGSVAHPWYRSHLLVLQQNIFDDWSKEQQRWSLRGLWFSIKDKHKHNLAWTMHTQSPGKRLLWEIPY